MLKIKRVTELAHLFLQLAIEEGDLAVDATAGNGNDTVLLARGVGSSGHVYAFDVQKEALDNTRQKLIQTQLLDRVTLIEDSHEKLDQYIKEKVKAVVYNLGYLPGGDRKKTTKHDTTLLSLKKALDRLKVEGLAVIVVYPGHSEGQVEKRELLRFCRQLPPVKYTVLNLNLANQPNEPPELVIIQRNLFGTAVNA
jgi:methylase of polypeptide subunit release factors